MNVNTYKLSLLAVTAALVAAVGCAQNNSDKKTDISDASKAAKTVVIREKDGVKQYALVDSSVPANASNPDEALMSSLNWQPLTDEMAMQASNKVSPDQVANNSYKVIPNPAELFAQAEKEKEEGASNWVAWGYGYPRAYGAYYNYYYPYYGYNNWFWPGYAYSTAWAYNYNYWPTYYTTYNWWYYQPAYFYNYWGYNYYWYNRWW